MWKAPNRPHKAISQTFNDGAVTICTVTDSAEAGRLPVARLTKCVLLHYEERKLGITRFYAAKQNNVQLERVIRVPKGPAIDTADAAITEDGTVYEIEQVQAVSDVYPACLDLTLKRMTRGYEVAE